MILDLQSTSETLELSSDICVIGSGAAGLAIASEMVHSRTNVLLVESGGEQLETPTQALYDVAISGLPHPGSTQGRFRVLGGSTTRWGGQALPLTPSDFEKRDWVAHSGWPISFDELAAYYERAHRFLMLDRFNFDTDLSKHLRISPPSFHEDQLWYHFSKWSPIPNLRDRYLPDIRSSDCCSLLLHANVTQIELDEKLNRVIAIVVRSLKGHTATLRAKRFVLCVGGIETARLLLSNNRQLPSGIGNENDLVGRYFQDHPSAFIGTLNSADTANVQRRFNVFHKGGLKYSVRCTATPKWQRQHQALNISMGISFESDQNSGLLDMKEVYTALQQRRLSWSVLAKFLSAMRHPVASLLPAYHYALRGRTFIPGAHMRIAVTTEQEPSPESRVLLSESVDALGTPRADVRWQPTNLSRHTIRQFAQTLKDEFRLAGLGEIAIEPWVVEDSPQWTAHITDQYHHIGTARMHDSPQQGVVDRNCKVHSISNLFIAGSAVFPTSGHSNPTLTIIALCMRLADRLRKE